MNGLNLDKLKWFLIGAKLLKNLNNFYLEILSLRGFRRMESGANPELYPQL
jgi:hypothetical protein